mmetsp:Transcript_2373/g.4886  ORF Transcript_2373/g.4886 Transcript_2373/m.4886 type:complete len:220 (-) Transcript_2373:2633-3292(-)
MWFGLMAPESTQKIILAGIGQGIVLSLVHKVHSLLNTRLHQKVNWRGPMVQKSTLKTIQLGIGTEIAQQVNPKARALLLSLQNVKISYSPAHQKGNRKTMRPQQIGSELVGRHTIMKTTPILLSMLLHQMGMCSYQMVPKQDQRTSQAGTGQETGLFQVLKGHFQLNTLWLQMAKSRCPVEKLSIQRTIQAGIGTETDQHPELKVHSPLSMQLLQMVML